MKTEKLELRAGLEVGGQLPYAYIRTLSAVTLGENPGVPELAELLEARFFDGEQEIRVFSRNGNWECVRLAAEPGDELLEKSYKIGNSRFGEKLTVVDQLEADEDGQTYVAATRLAGWERKERA